MEIFRSIEKDSLLPLMPSIYEDSPLSFNAVDINDMPYIQYKSCKYSIPRDYCFSRIHYKAVAGNLHVYDSERKYLFTHAISECKGSVICLEEHRKEEPTDWLVITERLRDKWNNFSFQAFINGLKKENPRHIRKQLRALEKFLETENPPKGLVAEVMGQCCQESIFRYSRFESIYHLRKAGITGDMPVTSVSVQQQNMEYYSRVFAQRCEM